MPLPPLLHRVSAAYVNSHPSLYGHPTGYLATASRPTGHAAAKSGVTRSRVTHLPSRYHLCFYVDVIIRRLSLPIAHLNSVSDSIVALKARYLCLRASLRLLQSTDSQAPRYLTSGCAAAAAALSSPPSFPPRPPALPSLIADHLRLPIYALVLRNTS